MDLEIMLEDNAAMDVDHCSAAGLLAPSLLAAVCLIELCCKFQLPHSGTITKLKDWLRELSAKQDELEM